MLREEILRLKKEKNAVILGHYYQRDEVQDIADYIGDSLYLAQVVEKLDAKIVVFCGVHFMAETAKILAPEKKILLPDLNAGCPMADMVSEQALIDYKLANPEAKIMCYVNSTATIKALSDVCVTSSNAMKIAKEYINQKVLYVPDQNLATYLNQQIPELDLDLWPGNCCIHNNLRVSEVEKMRELYPNAKLLVHPEANSSVVELADFVGSTKAIIEAAIASEEQEFIIGTERGVLYPLKKACPDKRFHLLSERLTCRTMKLTTLEKVKRVLETETNEIIVDESVAQKAKKALDLMLELS